MSQTPIREYDAKHIVFNHLQQPYNGYLIQSITDLEKVPVGQRVIKPDQLFGKRGKHGLIGVNMDHIELKYRLADHLDKQTTIDGKTDTLHTFLVEPFIPHTDEYYISIKASKDADIIYFSLQGGVEVEENWDNVVEVSISPLETLTTEHISFIPEKLQSFVLKVFEAYRAYGFVYLEVNPFVLDDAWNIYCLDMVAKVDNCEQYRQSVWKDINRVKPFGTKSYKQEDYIAAVDAKTGASLKLTIINPQGRIRLILGGGGASVVTMDSLANKWLMTEIANYGELSGNPDTDSNQAYVRTIIEMMLENTADKQYLCLIGWIANFTNIAALCKPFAALINEYADQLKAKNITILARRGGIDDAKWLAMIRSACEKHAIPYIIHDANHYLTDIFSHVVF
jgi:succinyl-CoA synthetase beta subunit